MGCHNRSTPNWNKNNKLQQAHMKGITLYMDKRTCRSHPL
jgi:hypothetical protein